MNISEIISDWANTLNKTYADSSLKAFATHMRKLNNNKTPETLDFLDDKTNIMEQLNQMKLNTRKTYLISISTVLKAIGGKVALLKKYDEELNKDNKKYNTEKSTHFLTETEEKNWTTLDTLKKTVLNKYRLKLILKGIIGKSEEPKNILLNTDLYLLQKYLIAALYLLQPSVRADYIMKIIYNEDQNDNKQNYLLIDKKQYYFIFNDFKTVKSVGKQKTEVPKEIKKILKIWIKFNKERLKHDNSLLINSDMNPLNNNGLVKLIPIVFKNSEKHITISLLRKIWISETIDGKNGEKNCVLAKAMHHSTNTQYNTYFKVVKSPK
tara:strand:+ start:67 stop:1038 length:972 start_codon:yes stop_codon:yes gene_type:complete